MQPRHYAMLIFFGVLIIALLVYTKIEGSYHQSTQVDIHQNTSMAASLACRELGCPPATMFVASKESKIYHRCDCNYARRINPNNLICFESKAKAEMLGFKPCSVCKP